MSKRFVTAGLGRYAAALLAIGGELCCKKEPTCYTQKFSSSYVTGNDNMASVFFRNCVDNMYSPSNAGMLAHREPSETSVSRGVVGTYITLCTQVIRSAGGVKGDGGLKTKYGATYTGNHVALHMTRQNDYDTPHMSRAFQASSPITDNFTICDNNRVACHYIDRTVVKTIPPISDDASNAIPQTRWSKYKTGTDHRDLNFVIGPGDPCGGITSRFVRWSGYDGYLDEKTNKARDCSSLRQRKTWWHGFDDADMVTGSQRILCPWWYQTALDPKSDMILGQASWIIYTLAMHVGATSLNAEFHVRNRATLDGSTISKRIMELIKTPESRPDSTVASPAGYLYPGTETWTSQPTKSTTGKPYTPTTRIIVPWDIRSSGETGFWVQTPIIKTDVEDQANADISINYANWIWSTKGANSERASQTHYWSTAFFGMPPVRYGVSVTGQVVKAEWGDLATGQALILGQAQQMPNRISTLVFEDGYNKRGPSTWCDEGARSVFFVTPTNKMGDSPSATAHCILNDIVGASIAGPVYTASYLGIDLSPDYDDSNFITMWITPATSPWAAANALNVSEVTEEEQKEADKNKPQEDTNG